MQRLSPRAGLQEEDSAHTASKQRASGTSTVVETSSKSPTVEVDGQVDREADPR